MERPDEGLRGGGARTPTSSISSVRRSARSSWARGRRLELGLGLTLLLAAALCPNSEALLHRGPLTPPHALPLSVCRGTMCGGAFGWGALRGREAIAAVGAPERRGERRSHEGQHEQHEDDDQLQQLVPPPAVRPFVICGPSGVGKGTVVSRIMEREFPG